ncbi:MAG: hypothetical protein ACWGQW_03905 [bacterium]
MALTEYLCNIKTFRLANGESATATLESGTPYRHYQAWAHVAGAGTINVSAQPRFADANDGAATAFSAPGMKKLFQVVQEEFRPPTRGFVKKKDDPFIPFAAKSEVLITNSGANPVNVTVYQMAAADPGGA